MLNLEKRREIKLPKLPFHDVGACAHVAALRTPCLQARVKICRSQQRRLSNHRYSDSRIQLQIAPKLHCMAVWHHPALSTMEDCIPPLLLKVTRTDTVLQEATWLCCQGMPAFPCTRRHLGDCRGVTPACQCCSSMECRTWTRDGPDEDSSPAQECRAGCSTLCPSW